MQSGGAFAEPHGGFPDPSAGGVAPLPAEDRIWIRLRPQAGAAPFVGVSSTRAGGPARLLEGRPVQDVVDSVPLLFRMCGTAQALAALKACEQALAIRVPPELASVRRLLMLTEMARMHAWAIGVEWPALVGEAPEAERLRATLGEARQLQALLCEPDGGWPLGGHPLTPDTEALRAGIHRLAAGVRDQLLGADGVQWRRRGELLGWARRSETVAARVITHLERSGLGAEGASTIAAMPDFDEAELSAMLAADPTTAFMAHPTWQGEVYETGPYARLAEDPLILSLRAAYGNGLLPRFAARLVELLDLPRRMIEELRRLGPVTWQPPARRRSGTGLAVVEMARGRLIHRVEIENERTRRYQIVAPTEWNFHPRGPLAEGLRHSRPCAPPRLRRLAELLAHALDPCVACHILLEGTPPDPAPPQ